MTPWNTEFPSVLNKLHQLEFDYADGEGIDFEPYQAFVTTDETMEWFRAWTANPDADGSVFRIFGQDGTGGYAAFWLVAPSTEPLSQPIVFMGSEGEMAVISSDFDGYLWLLAGGFGPYEATAYPNEARRSIHHFRKFAREYSAQPEATPQQVITRAQESYPTFLQWIDSLCR